MALWQIKHRLTAAVLFARDCDSMRLCVEAANLVRANLARADLADAKGIRDILSIGPIGSRRDYLQALRTDDGIVIHTGCFSGPLADFKAAVQSTHGDNEYGQHYRLAIALIIAKLGGAA